jgi:hypothetical protein
MAATAELRERRARRQLQKLGLALHKSRTEDDAYYVYNPGNMALVYPYGLVAWATLEQIEAEIEDLTATS